MLDPNRCLMGSKILQFDREDESEGFPAPNGVKQA